MLPDARDGAQCRVLMIRIQIENRLQQHERHAVESDRVVAEPAPGQPGVLAAAETVLLGAGRIGIVQISVDGALAFRDFRRPIGDDLSIDPRNDLVARVVLQRRDEPCLGSFSGGRRTPAPEVHDRGRTRPRRRRKQRQRNRARDSMNRDISMTSMSAG